MTLHLIIGRKARRENAQFAGVCLAAIFLLTSACASEEAPPGEAALACQFTKCVCVQSRHGLFDKPERALVLWTDNGDAYCPEGFDLRRATPADNEFLIMHGG